MLIVPPSTADDLLACYKTLSCEERLKFSQMFVDGWKPKYNQLIQLFNSADDDDKNKFAKRFYEDFIKSFLPPTEWWHAKIDAVVVPQMEAIRRADKRARDRKPTHPERDKEIRELRQQGLSKGKIAILLKSKYPGITVNVVKAVLKRSRKTTET